MSRTKQPSCSECGRALYKTIEKGKTTKKDDPYVYCRNKKCPLFGGLKQNEQPPQKTRKRVSRTKLREKHKLNIQASVDLTERKKDEYLFEILKSVISVVNKKRDDIGFLCFVALAVKELGFRSEYEAIVNKSSELKKIFGETQ